MSTSLSALNSKADLQQKDSEKGKEPGFHPGWTDGTVGFMFVRGESTSACSHWLLWLFGQRYYELES